ncbi:MAG: DUF2975 domain-containing protein [Lachnospiraceae bacterium]|nr:DUF2975 domain-containing protein [Lachnospiraceae bacterium]
MNKENALKSINKIGKIGTVISTIMQILLIVSIVVVIAAAIAVLKIPDDTLEFRITSGGTIEFNTDGLAKSGIKLFANKPDSSNVDVNFSFNGIDYRAVNTAVEGNRVSAELEGKTNVINQSALVIVVIAAGVIVLITMAVMIFVKKLCVSIRDCSTPFEHGVIVNLEHCAWALIPWVIVCGIAKSVIEAVLSGAQNIMIGVSLSTILVIVLIFGLSYIFKYGAELQTESDETL